jgi:hypothetical protein
MRNRSDVAVGGRIVPRRKSQLARWECFAGYCTGEALHSSIAGLLQQLQRSLGATSIGVGRPWAERIALAKTQ